MPEATYVHLMIGHLPVMGVLFGILLLVWGFVRRNDEVKRASLALFVVSALGAAVTFASGERAEERVERLPGVSGRAIERHESAAKLAAMATYAVGAASLVGLVVLWKFSSRGRGAAATMTGVVLVMAMVAGALLARAANTGGAIRHPEIESGGSLVDQSDHRETNAE
jgi:uncharacterized membrane protein